MIPTITVTGAYEAFQIAAVFAASLTMTGCVSHHGRHRWIDPRPQFDKQGNPNFDTRGNYQGCHGVGCDVDLPND